MYFRELHENYTTRWWYRLLRSLLTVVLGFGIIAAPETTLKWFLPASGIALIFDGSVIALPLLLGKTTFKLWKIILLREIVQITVGVLLIFNKTVGLVLLALMVATLLLMRGVLELILFVEVHTGVLQRRWLLLTSLLFFCLSIFVFVSTLLGNDFAFDLFGVYLIFESLTHTLAGYRMRTTLSDILSYERSIFSDDPATTDADLLNESKPPFDHEGSFLLPHLDTYKYRKIMVLASHPDDLEGFAGGLVYRLCGDVVSVIFAGGDKGVWSNAYRVMDKGDYIQIRLDESTQAARLLGVREINYLGYLDRGVPVDEAAIQKTLQQFELHQPDLVISFEFFKYATPYPHPDHLATANVVRQAVARYEHADKLDYIVFSTLLPNCFVDVTGVRRIKLQALACHATQAQLNRLIFPFFEKLFSRLWGVFAGVEYAEGYRVIHIPTLRKKLACHRD